VVRTHKVREPVRRADIEESDHRHRLPLRTRHDWPSRSRAAEKRDELAPSHGALGASGLRQLRPERYHTPSWQSGVLEGRAEARKTVGY
jgi:hypothetical protein